MNKREGKGRGKGEKGTYLPGMVIKYPKNDILDRTSGKNVGGRRVGIQFAQQKGGYVRSVFKLLHRGAFAVQVLGF